jgi:hypothetical protein
MISIFDLFFDRVKETQDLLEAVGKTTLTFSANINVLSISATLPACWYHTKQKISRKYVHGNGKR